jgi:hypothetical protein
MTEAAIDFMCRGGMLISSRVISPAAAACRWSQIASMCQPGTNGVTRSITGQACRTKRRKSSA